jgi:hypothetical protein
MNDFIHIPGDDTADAATDINDINTDAGPAPVRINHLRQMKLIIVEAEGQLTHDDLADLRMEDLLALRRDLLASAAPRPT